MRMSSFLEDAELLLASGKSVLFAGPPGTGKTRKARAIAKLFTSSEPIVTVGRADINFSDLLVKRDDTSSWLLGPLALSLLASWVRICSGCPPVWLLLDEINRMNVDLVLGNLLLALDVEHRLYTPIISRSIALRLIRDDNVLEEVASVASICTGGCCVNIDNEAARRCLERVLEHYGYLPLPYSWRLLATMNYVDRAALFRMGFALLRRLPPVICSGEDWEPSFRYDKLIDCKDDPATLDAVNIAAKELTSVNNTFEVDRSAPVGIIDARRLIEATCTFKPALRVLSFVAKTLADLKRIGIELGPSVLTDTAKLLMASIIFANFDESLVEELISNIADIAVSSFVIPHVSSIAPRIKTELVLTGSSKRLLKLEKELTEMRDVLGESSRTAWSIEVLTLELPLRVERG